MKRPKHVRDWEKLQARYALLPNFDDDGDTYDSLQEIENRLVDSWFDATWEIFFLGHTLQGKLKEVNHQLDVVFMLELDPEIDGIYELTGLFEHFTQVKA